MAQTFSSRHTASFPALLRQAGASLAVSTYQAGHLILLRGGDVLNTHFIPLHKPMGITARGPRLTVGTDHRVLDWYNLPAVATKLQQPGEHDACFVPRRSHVTGNIDIHELAFDGQGELWLVNTRMSCLCTIDIEYSVVPRWRPPFVSSLDLNDRCHLNGLAMRDGQPTYVTALGESDVAGGWRENKASGGLLMTLENDRIIRRGLSMPHSPRWHDGRLWVLESGAGRLCTVDPGSGEMEVIVEMPGFTRGLDFIGHYAFVGLSQVRETAVFAGLPLTQRFAERHCGVWIVDTRQKQVVGQVLFEGQVQEIFAVQVLPWRYPALLEENDPLVAVSYSLPDEALQSFSRPDPLTLRLERATQAHRSGNLEEAIAVYREVLTEDDRHLVARFHLGLALIDAEKWQEAIDTLTVVVQRQPAHAEAHNALGRAWSGLQNWQEALNSFEQALAADQGYAEAHYHRALILLRQEHYLEGWKEYEWRLQLPGYSRFDSPKPLWQGDPIGDRTLLVSVEQGARETLQFARFLPKVAERCRKLVLTCPESLRGLLGAAEGVAEIRLPEDVSPDHFDLYCPLHSLPHVLQVSGVDLPGTVPYLEVPEYLVVSRLPRRVRPRVALAWSSGPVGVNPHHNCPASLFLDLARHKGVDFFSLQKPLEKEERRQLEELGITDVEPELTTWAHTAAMIRQMDLVVGTDTAVIHLAGALGIPAWVLLDVHADWIWPDEGENPWYPTVTPFHQQSPGEWNTPLSEIHQALETL